MLVLVFNALKKKFLEKWKFGEQWILRSSDKNAKVKSTYSHLTWLPLNAETGPSSQKDQLCRPLVLFRNWGYFHAFLQGLKAWHQTPKCRPVQSRSQSMELAGKYKAHSTDVLGILLANCTNMDCWGECQRAPASGSFEANQLRLDSPNGGNGALREKKVASLSGPYHVTSKFISIPERAHHSECPTDN